MRGEADGETENGSRGDAVGVVVKTVDDTQ